jgi:hypothetical protein
MPLPDQDVIHKDVAHVKYRSKIDLVDTYEQVQVEPRDVLKTLFSTITGSKKIATPWQSFRD